MTVCETVSTFFASASNWSGVSDCAPSQSARLGSLCTSMIRPSAPIAAAATASGSTSQLMPLAWLGSMTTGRCDRRLRIGTAEMSSVLRVNVS